MSGMKKVIGLGLAGLIVLSLAAAGTRAYLTDTENSQGNQVTAGTLDLWTNGANGTTQNIYATSLKPGRSVGPSTITLTNHGSHTGTSLAVSVAYAENDNALNPGLNMTADQVAQRLEVTTVEYDSADLRGLIVDGNGNGYKDLEDLKNSPFTLTGSQGTLNPSASKDFVVTLKVRSFGAGAWDITNDYRGDGVTIIITFILNQ